MKLLVELIGKVTHFGSLVMNRTQVRIPPVMADLINLTIMPHFCETNIHAFFGLDEPNKVSTLRGFVGRSEYGSCDVR
jgi:hypothetical protein